MTFEVLESLRLYLRSTSRAARVAANNCRQNGYKELALQHDNEAALGEKLLRDLAQERTTR